jgi:fido (protein-threonine AMPylation protein)
MYDPDRIEFRREFLDDYRPNVSMYLPEHTRQRLLASGRVANPERPPGTFVREILDKLLIDLSWSSSRLEGNTYSFFETKRLIETGEAAAGKTPTETQMVLNHKAAIEFLVDSADHIDVNRHTVLTLHALLAEGLLKDERAIGRLRQAPVSIGGSGYRPIALPQVIDECFQMILDKGAAIEDPFEQSFFLMVHLPYLQPFLDVNKRTSRLAANIPLIKKNLAPLSFIDVPERAYFDGALAVYELNRVELLRDVYLWAYETSSKRYITAYDRIPAPNPVRLKYRQVLGEVITEVVTKGLAPEDAEVRTLAAPRVEAADLDAFVELMLRELRGLHEFNIILFRLPLPVFKEWESVYGTQD